MPILVASTPDAAEDARALRAAIGTPRRPPACAEEMRAAARAARAIAAARAAASPERSAEPALDGRG